MFTAKRSSAGYLSITRSSKFVKKGGTRFERKFEERFSTVSLSHPFHALGRTSAFGATPGKGLVIFGLSQRHSLNRRRARRKNDC